MQQPKDDMSQHRAMNSGMHLGSSFMNQQPSLQQQLQQFQMQQMMIQQQQQQAQQPSQTGYNPQQSPSASGFSLFAPSSPAVMNELAHMLSSTQGSPSQGQSGAFQFGGGGNSANSSINQPSQFMVGTAVPFSMNFQQSVPSTPTTHTPLTSAPINPSVGGNSGINALLGMINMPGVMSSIPSSGGNMSGTLNLGDISAMLPGGLGNLMNMANLGNMMGGGGMSANLQNPNGMGLPMGLGSGSMNPNVLSGVNGMPMMTPSNISGMGSGANFPGGVMGNLNLGGIGRSGLQMEGGSGNTGTPAVSNLGNMNSASTDSAARSVQSTSMNQLGGIKNFFGNDPASILAFLGTLQTQNDGAHPERDLAGPPRKVVRLPEMQDITRQANTTNQLGASDPSLANTANSIPPQLLQQLHSPTNSDITTPTFPESPPELDTTWNGLPDLPGAPAALGLNSPDLVNAFQRGTPMHNAALAPVLQQAQALNLTMGMVMPSGSSPLQQSGAPLVTSEMPLNDEQLQQIYHEVEPKLHSGNNCVLHLSTTKISRDKCFQVHLIMAADYRAQYDLTDEKLFEMCVRNMKSCKDGTNEVVHCSSCSSTSGKLITIKASSKKVFEAARMPNGYLCCTMDSCKSHCSSSSEHLQCNVQLVLELPGNEIARSPPFSLEKGRSIRNGSPVVSIPPNSQQVGPAQSTLPQLQSLQHLQALSNQSSLAIGFPSPDKVLQIDLKVMVRVSSTKLTTNQASDFSTHWLTYLNNLPGYCDFTYKLLPGLGTTFTTFNSAAAANEGTQLADKYVKNEKKNLWDMDLTLEGWLVCLCVCSCW
ncbi:hypothetical protein Pelo_13422 [Pelomyxa schiedti]|nr:hypothetical protein Pelo_13422 [Pelomyxa schiedti]